MAQSRFFFPHFLKKSVRKSVGIELPLKVKKVKGEQNTRQSNFYWERMKILHLFFIYYCIIIIGSPILEKKEGKIEKKSIGDVELKIFFKELQILLVFPLFFKVYQTTEFNRENFYLYFNVTLQNQQQIQQKIYQSFKLYIINL